jgi:predicted Zn-dependent protease with MMP-like domain
MSDSAREQLSEESRERFDRLVEDAIGALPGRFRSLIDEIPVVVLDEPTREMLKDLGLDPDDPAIADEICGLHTGTAITERSVERDADLPTQVHLFRRGIVALAGGWDRRVVTEDGDTFHVGGEDEVYEEIRITLLHEFGHHFGLDEDDLTRLGFD